MWQAGWSSPRRHRLRPPRNAQPRSGRGDHVERGMIALSKAPCCSRQFRGAVEPEQAPVLALVHLPLRDDMVRPGELERDFYGRVLEAEQRPRPCRLSFFADP